MRERDLFGTTQLSPLRFYAITPQAISEGKVKESDSLVQQLQSQLEAVQNEAIQVRKELRFVPFQTQLILLTVHLQSRRAGQTAVDRRDQARSSCRARFAHATITNDTGANHA